MQQTLDRIHELTAEMWNMSLKLLEIQMLIEEKKRAKLATKA